MSKHVCLDINLQKNMQYLNKCLLTLRPQLFKGYPVDSVIHLSNNPGQVYSYHWGV